jgi:hypothetical protein
LKRFYILTLLIAGFIMQTAHAQTTLSPTLGYDGGNWIDSLYISGNDSLYAYCVTVNYDWLYGTDCEFAIANDQLVDSFWVEVEGHAGWADPKNGSNGQDNRYGVVLGYTVLGRTLEGDNIITINSGNYWNPLDYQWAVTDSIYGFTVQNSDAQLTYNDINSANFGLAIQGVGIFGNDTQFVDYGQITMFTHTFGSGDSLDVCSVDSLHNDYSGESDSIQISWNILPGIIGADSVIVCHNVGNNIAYPDSSTGRQAWGYINFSGCYFTVTASESDTAKVCFWVKMGSSWSHRMQRFKTFYATSGAVSNPYSKIIIEQYLEGD